MRGSTAGISDGLKGTSKTHYRFVTLLDLSISTFLIAPLVVSYWRGTFGLMDILVYPEDPFKSSVVSCVIGYAGTSVLTMLQDVLDRSLHPNTHRITYYAFSRLYTALFSFICVNHWRGGWMLLEHFTGTEPHTVAIITSASIVLLMLTKTLRNLSAPPFAIATDRREGYFEVPRAFKYSTQNLGWYLLDCVFSVCVVGSLVVSVWRGLWSLLEIYLYPGEPAKSALASMAIGYALVSRDIPSAAFDIYLLISFSGTINVWRGIWNCLNHFFLPNLPLLSFFITHSLCFLLLVLINSSNSILVRGVYFDCQEDGEQCVDFPCYYIRLFFQERRKKKLLRASEQRRMSHRPSETDTLMTVKRAPEIVSNHSSPSPTVNAVLLLHAKQWILADWYSLSLCKNQLLHHAKDSWQQVLKAVSSIWPRNRKYEHKEEYDKDEHKAECDKDEHKEECDKDEHKEECDKDEHKEECDKDERKEEYDEELPTLPLLPTNN
ncbi:hypothetical protein GE061_015973 [Apolygus lucorum]|uniref:Uncharacterized protein n=1 Tax=Apolygus lucorum TaxID=248454 RepID=A0A8S9XEW2_APOLU|nr:hypothetical protein GE061_015973 [Apolygus lucorum]